LYPWNSLLSELLLANPQARGMVDKPSQQPPKMVNFLQIGSMSGRSTLNSGNRSGPSSMGLVCVEVSRVSLEAVTKIVSPISAAQPDLPR
jgi:hypothetical protein